MARRLVGLFGMLLAWLAVACIGPAQASAAGTLTVSVQGQGSVTGDGIQCTQSGGPDCSQFYDDFSYEECDPERRPPCYTVTEQPVVQLTAGPDSNGFTYDGFNGCDSVAGRVCEVTVSENQGVTARFRDAQGPSVSAPTPSSGVRSGTFTISATASDNAGVTRVDFKSGAALLGSDTTAPYELSWNSTTTSDGAKSLTATAFDAAGNATTSASSTITVDNTAPALSITSGPDGQTFAPGSTQTWTFTATDSTTAVSAECRIIGATTPAFGACSGANTHAVSNLADGSYVFEARAKDGAGHFSPIVQRTFSIDGTPPETTIEEGPKAKTTKKRARFQFSSTEPLDATFECSLDGGGFEPCEANETFNVKKGRHKLVVHAIDAVGNPDLTPATWKWRRVSRR